MDTLPIDNAALCKIGYGLYVLTTRDGNKDNGMICNTVMQVTGNPVKLAVAINRLNFSHELVRATGKMNVACLDTGAPFELVQRFGFQSGKDVDKFDGFAFRRTANGLAVPEAHCNAYISLEVEECIDLGSHSLFICRTTEAQSLGEKPSLTYAEYHARVKPKPAASAGGAKKGVKYICPICGYVYEGEGKPPDDFVCPLCKHLGSEFVLDAPAEAPAEEPPAGGKYICPICGYVYEGEGKPPDDYVCPICKHLGSEFVPMD